MNRVLILSKLRRELRENKKLLGVATGSGMMANYAKNGGADFILALNSGRFRVMGRSSLAGFLPFENSNEEVLKFAAKELLPLLVDVPVIFGVNATDPLIDIKNYVNKVKELGFSGVNNYPTIGLFDGQFYEALEESGISYLQEVEAIRHAHNSDLLTIAFVFNPNQAKLMVEAGADIICFHCGLTRGGSLGAKKVLSLEKLITKAQDIFIASKSVRDDVITLIYGGPVNDIVDISYVYNRLNLLDGYIGGSTFDRITPGEVVIKKAKQFKQPEAMNKTSLMEKMLDGIEKHYDYVEFVKEYIAHNYMNEIILEDLAQVAHITSSYLSTLFKQKVGSSFTEYLIKYRLNQSIRLFTQYPKLQLKEVASLVGTLDTKGKEYLFIKNLFEKSDVTVLSIHTGVFEPQFQPDINNDELAKAAGVTIDSIIEKKDRAYATEVLAKGMKKLIPELYKQKKFDGIISFGGSGGSALAAQGMQSLPLGVPKIMVSTMAAGDVTPYVGTSDIMMIPSIVDISGLNSISQLIFSNAVNAMVGMLNGEVKVDETKHKPLIAATMFGVTTPAVTFARDYLEDRGYEVLVFHATGSGGKTMEALIEAGFINGVLDLTTTEWADELIGGVLNGGEHRLEAAAKKEIPQVVSLGALDMVNFGPFDTVPKKFEERDLYRHNPTVTLMRTTVAENQKIGRKIAEKLNLSKGKTKLIIPLKGFSALDKEAGLFYGKEEDKMLIQTLKEDVDLTHVELIERNEHINDESFAIFAAQQLIELIEK